MLASDRQTENNLSRQVSECCCELGDAIKDVTINVNEKFCNLEHNVDNKFFHLERFVDKKFDEVRERECAATIAAQAATIADMKAAATNTELSGALGGINVTLNTVVNLLSTLTKKA